MARTSSHPHPTTTKALEASTSEKPGDAPENAVSTDVAGVSATETASQKRGRGRPPKAKPDSTQNAAVSASPAVPTASAAAGDVKRTPGRPKRSNPPAVTTATAVDGSKKRGRPKKDDGAAATVAPAKRGRKPNAEVAAARTTRRTRKDSSVAAPVAASNLGDLKKRTALLQKKVKEAAAKLQIAVAAIEEVQKIAAGM